MTELNHLRRFETSKQKSPNCFCRFKNRLKKLGDFRLVSNWIESAQTLKRISMHEYQCTRSSTWIYRG